MKMEQSVDVKMNTKIETILPEISPERYATVSHQDFLESLSFDQRVLKDHTEKKLIERSLTNKRICFNGGIVTYLINPDNGIAFDLHMNLCNQKGKENSNVGRLELDVSNKYTMDRNDVFSFISQKIIYERMISDGVMFKKNFLSGSESSRMYYPLEGDLETNKQTVSQAVRNRSEGIDLLEDPELIMWAKRMVSLDEALIDKEMTLERQRESYQRIIEKMRERK